jgi:hypothetical protein
MSTLFGATADEVVSENKDLPKPRILNHYLSRLPLDALPNRQE